MSTIPLISGEALARALRLRDLSDPLGGPHAMQALVSALTGALRDRWGCPVQLHRPMPLVRVADNYDRLGYPPDGPAREARYSRYVTADTLLRTHTSAGIPPLLRALSPTPPDDLILALPGLVYRRDVIDRLHTGEPHQIDLWRLCDRRCTAADLRDMIATVLAAALPNLPEWRTAPRAHPYTRDGLQIDVRTGDGEWVEVGECGLADPDLLARCGLPAGHGGLAMGLGLDRLLMLRKQIPDIRLLRTEEPRVARQMQDLAPYVPVSRHPAARRDISVMTDTGDEEVIGDRVREALGEAVDCVEEAALLSATPSAELPPSAVARMGARPGQINVLLRLVLRHPGRTLTGEEANAIRDRIYHALHQGDRAEV